MSAPPQGREAGLAPDGDAQIERGRRALLDAGQPPELPPTLHDPPDPGAESRVGRYRYTAVATAIAVAVAMFAVGYVLGGGSTPEQPVSTTTLTGAGGSSGDVVVLARDAGGNWPVELSVTGLATLGQGDAYELRARPPDTGEVVVGRFRGAGDRELVLRFTTPADVGRGAAWKVARASSPDVDVLRASG